MRSWASTANLKPREATRANTPKKPGLRPRNPVGSGSVTQSASSAWTGARVTGSPSADHEEGPCRFPLGGGLLLGDETRQLHDTLPRVGVVVTCRGIDPFRARVPISARAGGGVDGRARGRA